MSAGNGLRRFFESLSTPPAHTWPDAVLHHGARIVVLLALAVATSLLFPVAPMPELPRYEVGDIPDQDIIARVDFTVYKSDAELAREQAEAAAVVAPTFRLDPAGTDTMTAQIEGLIARMDSAVAMSAADTVAERRLAALLSAYSLPATDAEVDLLLDRERRAELWASLRRTLATEMALGVAAPAELEESRAAQIRVVRDDSDLNVAREAVPTPPRLHERARAYLSADAPPVLQTLQQLILIRFFQASLRMDRIATERDRDNARRAVPLDKERVLAGQRIVAAHEQVSAERVERLRAYQAELGRQGRLEAGPARLGAIIAAHVLNLLILAIFGFLLFFYRPRVYGDFRHVGLLAFLFLAVAIGAAIVSRTAAPVELVPIAFAALVIAVLWDGRMALNFALVVAILLSAQTPLTGIDARLLMIIGGAAAALSVRVVRRRAQGLILGAVVALAYVTVALALALLLSWEPTVAAERALWGSVNGIASALLAMGLLPLFETFTRITTDQTLLEMADLSRPLLKRLSLEAPGTYAHSINVANLAEAGARAIDANPLLVRVGAYYHDVGKIVSPQYFIENQQRGRNPHDLLDPATSAAIVRGHVIEGMKLAEQAGLPDCVKVFIPEHHGTQTIGFFWDQARQNDPDADLDPAEFAYPGPVPRSRETAILMLADSVESAAKVLQEPTTERIRGLVDRIADAKIARGQLDEAPLTLEEITRIKNSFQFTLLNMFHARVAYPTSGQAAVKERA